MFHLRQKLVCSCLLLILACVPVYAADNKPAESAYDLSENLKLGSAQFQQGKYPQAKQTFERALEQAQKQRKPLHTIYYNLGSVSYRLQQYPESKRYFNKLLKHKELQALAYYNLALIENRQSNKDAAINYFNKSKQLSDTPEMSALVEKQLQTLEGKNKEQKDWRAYLYLSHGYDSNIRFAPLEIASNESGTFFQAYGLFDKRIMGKGYGKKEPALLVTAAVFLTNYYSSDFNDYNIYDVGLSYLFSLDSWRNTLDLNLKQSTYGHIDYQQSYVATFKSKRKLSNGDTFRLRYRYEEIDSREPVYDYLQGSRQKLRLGYQFKWPRDALNLWYELEVNDRQNTETRNYSPTRNGARVRYEKIFSKQHKAYIEASYRRSEYDPTAVQDRQDNRSDILVAYVYDFARDWQLMARWIDRTNRSTDSIFSYDRHIGMITVRKKF